MNRISTIADRTIQTCFLLLAILVPLILTPVNYELFEYNKMMLTYGITAVIACAWVSKMIAQKRIFVARTPFDIPIGLFVLSQFISTLFSMDPMVSWFGYYSRFNGGMLSILCYTLLFYAFVSNIQKEFGKKLLFALLGSTTVVAMYGVLQHFGIDKHIWVQDVQARVFSTLGQPNWLAAYLVAIIPLTLFSSSILSRLLATLFFVTLLFTRSRSGLLAFAIVDVLWIVLFIKSQRAEKIQGLALNLVFVICIFLFGTGIQKIDRFITLYGLKNQLITKNYELTTSPSQGPVLETGGTESGVIRKYVWQTAINAWLGNPKNILIGTGTETFAFAFYQYKPVGHNLTSEWDFLYNKAHNEYLNFLATTGVFGLGSYVFLIGTIIFCFLKKIHIEQSDAIVIIGLFYGWLSLLMTNFFGFSVVVTHLLFFLLPAAALVMGDALRVMSYKIKLSFSTQRFFLIVVVFLITLIVSLITLAWWADKTFATGYRLSRAGQYANAYSSLRNSIRLNRFVPLYHDEYAVVLSSLAISAFESQDATLAGTLAVASLMENDSALRLSPHNVNVWKSRTKIFYALATLDEAYLPQAIEALIHAQTLSPHDPKITYNLAILYGKIGDSEKAVTYLLDAKRIKPNYKDAYYALFIFYKEMKQPDKAKEIIQEYLTMVDSRDEEFKKLVE